MAQSDMEVALELVRRAALREALLGAPTTTTFMGYTVEQIVAMRAALEEITKACEADCGIPTSEDGDDDPVAATQVEHGPIKSTALTFGILRRARAAIPQR